MTTGPRFRPSSVAAAAITTALLAFGCVARVGFYDPDHQDYHRWDDREDRAYRHFLLERRQDYRRLSSLSTEDQREYWRWRHSHDDAGN